MQARIRRFTKLMGGIRATQQMLDFCVEHGIGVETEVIPVEKINEAYDRVAPPSATRRGASGACGFLGRNGWPCQVPACVHDAAEDEPALVPLSCPEFVRVLRALVLHPYATASTSCTGPPGGAVTKPSRPPATSNDTTRHDQP
ncbi:hypothetical protein AQJ91_27225 [Streptomyces dysideae]|uniref:Uncharacterized protein n=1 Tax=Streptomyces dysideae TaxID=909626 RepID=A0A101UWC5_9ACTN|nr:hypothetical protein AQJ91_27225 [Streptomyces dysideae]